MASHGGSAPLYMYDVVCRDSLLKSRVLDSTAGGTFGGSGSGKRRYHIPQVG